MNYVLKEYWDKTPNYSKSVLKITESDIDKYCNDPYDPTIKYAGRLDSRVFTITGLLVPEFDMNEIFYVHDRMYELAKKKIVGYTKEFADLLMRDLMIAAGHPILAEIYYFAVDKFASL